jgi:hypothetical protein
MLAEASLQNALGERASDAINYIVECMEPIPPDYTQKTFEESGRIQKQLEGAFSYNGIPVTFGHQGSVTNDTHIKYHSDIDLLVATEKFIAVAPPLQATPPYTGNPTEDLRQMRAICTTTLTANFPKAKVDVAGARSVSISGGSLSRKIDVVPCNWLHTQEYVNGQKYYRGIEILNSETLMRETNFPFLHNQRIDKRDKEVGGNLRRLIRLAKSIRSDSDENIDVSSYDIAALCYAMPPEQLAGVQSGGQSLGLFLVFGYKLISTTALQSSLEVPNGTRRLVCGEGLQLAELLKLCQEGMELLERSAKES